MSEISWLDRYWMNGYIPRARDYRRSHFKGENNMFSLGHLEFEVPFEYPTIGILLLAGYDCKAQRRDQCCKFGS